MSAWRGPASPTSANAIVEHRVKVFHSVSDTRRHFVPWLLLCVFLFNLALYIVAISSSVVSILHSDDAAKMMPYAIGAPEVLLWGCEWLSAMKRKMDMIWWWTW
jgi:hypothetical protein